MNELTSSNKTPGAIRRNLTPLTSLLGALIIATMEVLRTFGITITDTQSQAISTWVGLAFLLATTLLARTTATPVVDPRSARGDVLVPARTLEDRRGQAT